MFLAPKLFHALLTVSLLEKKSQLITYLLNGSEHIYRILDLENEVHSIWVTWTSGLQECKGNFIFRSQTERTTIFNPDLRINFFFVEVAQRNQFAGLSPYPPPLKVRGGCLKSVDEQLYGITKKWLPPRQATMQAAKWSRNVDCFLPQRNKYTAFILFNIKYDLITKTFYCCVQFFTFSCLFTLSSFFYFLLFQPRSLKGSPGCGSPGHVPSPPGLGDSISIPCFGASAASNDDEQPKTSYALRKAPMFLKRTT